MNASKGMIRVKDPITLLKIITRFIDRQMGVTHVAVMLFDKAQNAYILIDSKGEGGVKLPVDYIKIPRDSAIVRFFQASNNGVFARKEALVYSELDHLQNFEILVNKKESRAIHYEDIQRQMTYFRAAVCVPSFYKKELIGVLILGDKLSGERYREEEIGLFVTLANDVAMAVKNAELIKDLKVAYDREHLLFLQTSIALANAIDARDRYTLGHSEQVSHYSLIIAEEMVAGGAMAYDREFMETVQLSALLHDVGKIGIRDQILNKPERLTAEEFEIMKMHVSIGATIVKPVKGLANLTDGILYHHERWDGKGYMTGLKGEEIPLLGRIVNVADSYDTMTATRSYKKASTANAAFEELIRCKGTQFDPTIVDAFYKAYTAGKITKRDFVTPNFLRLH